MPSGLFPDRCVLTETVRFCVGLQGRRAVQRYLKRGPQGAQSPRAVDMNA